MYTEDRREKYLVIIALLVILIAYVSTYTYRLYIENTQLRNRIAEIENRVNVLEQQLSYYRMVSGYLTNTTILSNITGGGVLKFHAVAVGQNNTGYFGVVLNFTISIVPGNGRVLVNTQPKIGIDLQTSLQIAKMVAETYTSINLSSYDIILSIQAPMEVDVVDGPSAGAAITATIISLMLNKSINQSVYITGTINPDGSIGKVGGILEKALAAAENNGKLFIVPPGQTKVKVYIPVRREIFPGFYLITYEAKIIDVQEYLDSKGYNIKVIEVGSIEELLNYLWTKN